ncbi:XRE family transcriptional regulator [Rubrivivax gelatinosus]|uniref:XRE family transcriptional regulator n=1 Tax=Rubrivivax gelatinosus TaxID=28068 RepID=UPI0019076D27|nr:LexA family transcriptional regulator [Rubrivivax gelatinosus]
MRLKAERQRLHMTQGELAAAGGVSKTSQVNYEGGSRAPDAIYLHEVAKAGVDTAFVITGESAQTTSHDIVLIRLLGGQEDDEGHPFHRRWLTAKGLAPQELCIVEVKGSSMEKVLSHGDHVLVNRADRQPQSGFSYALRQGDELLVRYCQVLPGGVLKVSGANADYAAYEVDPRKSSDVEIIGRVVSSTHEW